MSISRTRKFLVSLLAVMSLFVSAVSACACSHHVEPKKAELSCHSATHEMSAETASADLYDTIETDCNCLVKTPVPAIVAKTDDKRPSLEKQIGTLEFALAAFVPIVEFVPEPGSLFTDTSSHYKQDLLSSLPSRAPPRL